jgi:cytidylate kinase
MLTSERIVVLDGHDGCGKSTLNEFLARHIGATVVEPFADTLGDHIAWLWQLQRFTEADTLARASVERVLAKHPGKLVFDRHWATMFTVLPEELWVRRGSLPRTVICTRDLATVVERLARRAESIGDRDQHAYYPGRYVEVAGCCPRHLILDTGKADTDACLSEITAFLEQATEEGRTHVWGPRKHVSAADLVQHRPGSALAAR